MCLPGRPTVTGAERPSPLPNKTFFLFHSRHSWPRKGFVFSRGTSFFFFFFGASMFWGGPCVICTSCRAVCWNETARRPVCRVPFEPLEQVVFFSLSSFSLSGFRATGVFVIWTPPVLADGSIRSLVVSRSVNRRSTRDLMVALAASRRSVSHKGATGTRAKGGKKGALVVGTFFHVRQRVFVTFIVHAYIEENKTSLNQ